MSARLFPAVLSLLVLGAHFLRRGLLVPCALCIAVALLLTQRKAWVPLVVRGALVLGTLEWVLTTVVLTRERAAAGGPVLRLVLILGFVTLFTAASAWLVGTRPVRERYAARPTPVESA